MLISPQYKALNAELHEKKASFGGTKGNVGNLVKIAEGLGTQDVLDYGCGKGAFGKLMPWPIKEYDPAIPGKDDQPAPADIVICRDVLEHVEPECIEEVLADLSRCTKRLGLFSIATGPSWKNLSDGRNAHLIQQPYQWWKERLEKYFRIDGISETAQISEHGSQMFIGGSTLFVAVKPKLREPIRIFIGYDAKETIAYHVLSHSILSRAKSPISITPIARGHLHGIYTRSRGPTESTDFSLTRFLVPYLSGYQGYSIFMDCDMLCLSDISDLIDLAYANPQKAVWVCPHEYTPKTQTKFLGQTQTVYPRKNWSSLMIFKNAACRALTPEFVNTATGLELHRLTWTEEERVGFLPIAWNWLVGEYAPNKNARMLHYTLGTPCFPEYRNCDHADLWWNEFYSMKQPA